MDREPIDFGFVLNEKKTESLYTNEPIEYQVCTDARIQIPSIELGAVNKLIYLLTTSNANSSLIESYCREIAGTLQCLLEVWNEKKLNELLCNDSTLMRCERCGVISHRKRTHCSTKPANPQPLNSHVVDTRKIAKNNGGNYLRMYQERKKYKQDGRCNEELKNRTQKFLIIDSCDIKNNLPIDQKSSVDDEKCLPSKNIDCKDEVRENENMEAERDEAIKVPMKYESRIFVNSSIQKHNSDEPLQSNGNTKVLCLSVDERGISTNHINDDVGSIGYMVDFKVEGVTEIKNKSRADVENAVNDKQRAKIQGQQEPNNETSNTTQRDRQNQPDPEYADTFDSKKQTSNHTQCLEPNFLSDIVTSITDDPYKKKQLTIPCDQASVIDTMKYLARGHLWGSKKENVPRSDELPCLRPRHNGKKESFVLHGTHDEHPQLDRGFWLYNKRKQMARVLGKTVDSGESEKAVRDLEFEAKREASSLTQSAENDSLEDCSLNPSPPRPGESETTTAFSSSSAENMIREWVNPVRDGMHRINIIDEKRGIGRINGVDDSIRISTNNRINESNGINRINRIDEINGISKINRIGETDGMNGINNICEINGVNGSNKRGETNGSNGSNKIDKTARVNGIEQRRDKITSEIRDRGKAKPDAVFVQRIRDQIAEAIDRYVNYSMPSSNKVNESKDGYIDHRDTTLLTEDRKLHDRQIELSKLRVNEFRGSKRMSDRMRKLESKIDSSDIKQNATFTNTATQLGDSIWRNESVKQKSLTDINEVRTSFLPKQNDTTVSARVASADKVRNENEKMSSKFPSENTPNSEHFERQIIYDSASFKDIAANESECSASEVLPMYQKILESSEQMDWESFQLLVEALHPGQKELWADICRAISNEAKRVAGESGCTTEVCIEINPISPDEREGKVKTRGGEITFEMDMTLRDVRNFLNAKFEKLREQRPKTGDEKVKGPESIRKQGR